MKQMFDNIADKVNRQERLTDADAQFLFEYPNVHEIGILANQVRERKHGNRASFVFNRFLNYSNICILNCQFCAFAKKKRNTDAFEYSVPELVEAARKSVAEGITELHIVGGLHPSLPFSYYLEMLQELKKLTSSLHIKIFTAIEILHLAQRVYKKSVSETLEKLREAGLDSLTGGGAEILDQSIREQICKGKELPEEWLNVHRTWHQMGGRSTCTMLFGHIETHAHRVAHLRQLRQLQDETKGFTALVPYAFEPEHTHLPHISRASALEELRTLAISRLYLDNFDHITAYWISMGLPTAQVALSYGADDLHGTIFEEKIFHMAGAKTPMMQATEDLENAILETGREPFQRDSFYHPFSKQTAVPSTCCTHL